MSARTRWAGVALAAVLITTLAAGAPGALRRMDGFVVRQVEIRGTRLLDPAAALMASAIPAHATVFDDFTPWRDALLRHPLVRDARVARRLPDTIVLEITESEPLALARTPELRPVDARGFALPIPPEAGLDLPVLGGAARLDGDGRLVDEAHLTLLDALAFVQAHQPALADWVSEAHLAASDGVKLVLRWPAGAEILLPRQPDADRLHQLALVLGDLAAAPAAAGDSAAPTELQRLLRLDARFRDQVVVSLAHAGPPTPSTRDR